MRPPPSRCFSLVMSFLGTALAFFVPAHAQQHYPSRPVTAVVPFAAGGNTDQMARPFFDALGKVMGGAFVVDNRGGAGGTIGAAQIAAAPADGYTLGFSPTSPITNSPHLDQETPLPLRRFRFHLPGIRNIFTRRCGAAVQIQDADRACGNGPRQPRKADLRHSGRR